MQLYSYQDIINKQPVYIIYARKKIDIFMKCLDSNSFIKLESFYDQRIKVTLCRSIQRFSTKDIYILQKAMFIISYIYWKTIVKENCSYCQQKVLFVRELQIQQKVMFIAHLSSYISQSYIRRHLLYSYSFVLTRNLFIYLFIFFIYQIFIRNIFIKNLSGYISENFLYIMIYK